MTTSLPQRPNLDQLRKQAKDLLKAQKKGDTEVCKVLRHLNHFSHAPDADILSADLKLNEVQFALALEYGFSSWNALIRHIESLTPELKHFGPYRVIGLSSTDGRHTELWAGQSGFMARRGEIRLPAGDGAMFGMHRCLPGGAEYIAAIAVTPNCPVPDGMIEAVIGDATHAVFTVEGIHQISRGWDAAHAWVANSTEWQTYCVQDENGVCGCRNYPCFELYPADHAQTNLVYIYFPVKRRA